MSTIKLGAVIQLVGSEIFTSAEAPAAANEDARTLKSAGNNLNLSLNGSSTPKVDQPIVSLQITLGAGITTLDLAAIAALTLPAAATRTVDLTGAKVVAWRFSGASANDAGGVLIAPGATNPYPLFGAAKEQICYPNETLCGIFSAATLLPAVAAGVKEIDLSGTTGDVVNVDLYLGT